MQVNEHFWKRANTAMSLLIIGGVILLAALMVTGCGGKYKPLGAAGESGLTAATTTANNAANKLREGLNRINNAAAKLEAVAADEQAVQVSVIQATTLELREIESMIGSIEATTKTADKQYATLAKNLKTAETKIAELESTKGSAAILRGLLAYLGAFGILVAAVTFGWLRSMPGLVTGLTLFALCAIGAIVLQYAVYVAIVAGLIVTGYVIYEFFRQGKTNVQLVRTGEAIKANPKGFAAKAREIQDTYTKQVVDFVQAQHGKIIRKTVKAKRKGAK